MGNRCISWIFAGIMAALSEPSTAQPAVQCGPFTEQVLPAPQPRFDDARARAVFEEIKLAVKTQPHRVLFLGDSLTEGFNSTVWGDHLAPRGVLNAGVGGDSTEELLWRLQNGNLEGPEPEAVVLLIGSNDLARGQTPEATAEGIRRVLLMLRQRLARAKILLLGLWPREDKPQITEQHEVSAVNGMISKCADGDHIRYADIGYLLLEPDGHLSREVSPDLVHFSAKGYARLAPYLDSFIDKLLNSRHPTTH